MRITIRLTLISWLAVFALRATGATIDFQPHGERGQGGAMTIKGEIRAGDEVKIQRLTKDEDGPISVMLTSRGGDLDTAMRIGRTLRSRDATTFSYEECLSACVFILISGVQRDAIAPIGVSHVGVGIHRFYFASLPGFPESADVKTRYQAVKRAVLNYLDEMNVAPDLVSMMEAVPPDKIRYLTEQQASQLLITGTDPVWEEREVGREAYRLNLSSSEYRHRREAVETTCKSPRSPQYRDCSDRIYFKGIPTAEIARRREKYNELMGNDTWLAAKQKHGEKRMIECFRKVVAIGGTDC
jgi:hypothetical protein